MAAPSQRAALKAWGTTTDLFAAGRATIVEDEALQAEALAQPGQVIKRPRGDTAAMLGPEPDPLPSPAPARKAPARRQPPPPPPPPDRSALNAPEKALAEAELELSAELEVLAVERADLDRREAAARAAADERRQALELTRGKAEAAHRRDVERAARVGQRR